MDPSTPDPGVRDLGLVLHYIQRVYSSKGCLGEKKVSHLGQHNIFFSLSLSFVVPNSFISLHFSLECMI